MDNTETNDISCLFLTRYRLVRAKCTFEVIARHTTSNWNKGDRIKVEKVKDFDETTILFKVKSGWYSHSFFYYYIPTDLVLTGVRK